MKLNTKARFAVTAILDVALNARADEPVNLAAVAARQDISLSYLEQLFGKLRRQGLVHSVRGPGGGYVLGQPAEHINVAQIVSAVDEPVELRLCAGNENCRSGVKCMTHDLWSTLNEKMQDYLVSVSIADLIAAHHAQVARVSAQPEFNSAANHEFNLDFIPPTAASQPSHIGI